MADYPTKLILKLKSMCQSNIILPAGLNSSVYVSSVYGRIAEPQTSSRQMKCRISHMKLDE